jgi:membrane protease subunit HflK
VAQITQAAEAYREQTVAEATGEAARFVKIYDQYRKAPDVTRQRMYLETMERIFGNSDKVIMDSGQGGTGVVPYLPLRELSGGSSAQQSPRSSTPQSSGNSSQTQSGGGQ